MKRTIEQEITLKLIEKEGIIGVPNTKLIQDAKAQNQLFRHVWDKVADDEPGITNTLWRIVQSMIGWRGG